MKTGLDETDAEILRLLVEDGRMAYTEIADEVGMSPPSVIERVERLREKGVLEGFEARLDRSVLGGSRLLLRFRAPPDETSRIADEVADDERVDTVFVSADGTLTAVVNAEPEAAYGIVGDVDAHDYDLEVVVEEIHAPTVSAPSFAPDCVECGNTVDEEGVTARIAGEVYHFCCTSCESAFRDRYEAME
ncbi:MAG: AsnC family transcriptional regulator [Halobacteriales archaeon]|nr:AsnC family transcriptional regulator [Halobacteriales archaeon]